MGDDMMTAEITRSSPWKVMARAIRLLPRSIQRRLIVVAGMAAVMAVMEAASFALLFYLIQVLTDPKAALPGVAGLLGASHNADSFLARCGALVLGLFLMKSAGTLLLMRISAGLHADSDSYLSKALFARYMALPYPEFIQKNSADMIVNAQYRTGDVAANAVSGIVTLASEGAILAGVGVTLALVQPWLAAGVVLFMALVGTGLLAVLAPAARRVGHTEAVESTLAQQALQESMGGIKAIKANELTSKFLESFSARRDALASVRRRKVFLLRLPVFYLESALFLGLGVLAVVIFHTQSRSIVPVLGVLVAAAFRMLPSVSRILGTITAVRNAEAPLGFIERDLAGPPIQTTTAEGPHISLDEALSVRQVGFRYPGAPRDALAAMTIDIAAGESIGLVGPSGSGKTTFVDIILGLLEPTEGELLVDGEVLTAARLPGWRRTIGYVPQDVFLVDGTIRDNIVFGRQVDDDGRLVEAVKLAQLDTVVADLPDGLETVVGERGVRLSGGQRQRIGIARALYNRPSLLILDEATSALDTKTEAAITDSIEALHGRTTTIVIAHRLSTVQHCDRIVYLDEGQIKAVGTFAELQRERAAFAELVRLGQLEPERRSA